MPDIHQNVAGTLSNQQTATTTAVMQSLKPGIGEVVGGGGGVKDGGGGGGEGCCG